MRRIDIDRKELRFLYERKRLTTYQIAEILGCCQATIWKRIHEFGIKPRPSVKPVNLPKKKLWNLYYTKGLSTWEIEKRYGYCRSSVYRKLCEYNIPIRNLSKSHIIYPRKEYNGNQIEKAYLIGFALGDLRARKFYRNSETIKVDCGSTKKEQIGLINNLFKEYGRVWISKPNKRGAIQIEASLDLSFSFLLNIREKIHAQKWIWDNKECFYSFLSGFIDAEGSIFISEGMACCSIGNYDSQILQMIYDKLMENGIICPKPYEDNTKGYIKKDGYIHNENYWTLRINRKDSLLKLFHSIEPHIRHKNKIIKLKEAKRNIIRRNVKFGNKGESWKRSI